MMSDWSPDTEDGGSIWASGDTHERIDEHRQEGESPNQCLQRVLGDEPQVTTGGPQVKDMVLEVLNHEQDKIRDLARQEAEEVFEQKRREYS